MFARPQVLVLELVSGAISLDELQSLRTKPGLLASQHGDHVPADVLLSTAAKVFDPTLEQGRRRLKELGQVLAGNRDRLSHPRPTPPRPFAPLSSS